MKLTFITTVNHNVGDDFVREGLTYLLKAANKTTFFEFENIHKHCPISTRRYFEDLRNQRVGFALDRFLPKWISKDKILDADVVVQSGAPVYWCHENIDSHCFENEWYQPLIRERFQKKNSLRLLNVAAGTCQKYHSSGDDFCSRCSAYIGEFYNVSHRTTLRDRLAGKVLNSIGYSAPVIPCSSIFARDEFGLQDEGSDYVVVNFMEGGAHYAFGQNIDAPKWRREFVRFYNELKLREKVVFACHDGKEVDAAKSIDPNADVFYAKNDYLAYMKFYSRAKFGIMNRVHGAFLMASFGKPSIIIGNDSRARMAEEVGLESVFVNDMDYEALMTHYEYLRQGANHFADRFASIKENALQLYLANLALL